MTVFPADLYLDRVDWLRYFTDEHKCRNCGVDSCKALVQRLVEGSVQASELSFLSTNRIAGLDLALRADRILPQIPKMELPRPTPAGLAALNGAGPGDPVLVTGNSQFTQEVLLAVLSMSLTPLHLLCVDTRGDTLDMALILDTFTPQRVQQAVAADDVAPAVSGSTLVLPGLASTLATAVRNLTGHLVQVGPVCAAEIPLMFGDRWIPA